MNPNLTQALTNLAKLHTTHYTCDDAFYDCGSFHKKECDCGYQDRVDNLVTEFREVYLLGFKEGFKASEEASQVDKNDPI
jgi:hypothetical protein